MHGPFGVAFHTRNVSNRPDEEIEQGVVSQLHPLIKSLPGFLSVTYYNVDQLDYHFVISVADEASADHAVATLRNLFMSDPDATISKAEVLPGEVVDGFLAGTIQR